MIGMSFASFFTLLILGFIAAIAMHSAIRYRMVGGADGFVAQCRALASRARLPSSLRSS